MANMCTPVADVEADATDTVTESAEDAGMRVDAMTKAAAAAINII